MRQGHQELQKPVRHSLHCSQIFFCNGEQVTAKILFLQAIPVLAKCLIVLLTFLLLFTQELLQPIAFLRSWGY